MNQPRALQGPGKYFVPKLEQSPLGTHSVQNNRLRAARVPNRPKAAQQHLLLKQAELRGVSGGKMKA